MAAPETILLVTIECHDDGSVNIGASDELTPYQFEKALMFAAVLSKSIRSKKDEIPWLQKLIAALRGDSSA